MVSQARFELALSWSRTMRFCQASYWLTIDTLKLDA